jgi:hypothetical protein
MSFLQNPAKTFESDVLKLEVFEFKTITTANDDFNVYVYSALPKICG